MIYNPTAISEPAIYATTGFASAFLGIIEKKVTLIISMTAMYFLEIVKIIPPVNTVKYSVE
ncbi:hypothetical protein D3C71_1660750 [compost metagenome]